MDTVKELYDEAFKSLKLYEDNNKSIDNLLSFYYYIVNPCNEDYKDSRELFNKYYQFGYNYFYRLYDKFNETNINNLYTLILIHHDNQNKVINDNLDKVFKIYQNNQWNKYALNNLGIMYYHGIYVKKDINKGLQYLNKSQTSSSFVNLSWHYAENDDRDKGIKLLKKAAKLNDSAALNILGGIYREEKKYTIAFEYLIKSVNFGNHNAIHEMGLLLKDLNSFSHAIEYFERYIKHPLFKFTSNKVKKIAYDNIADINKKMNNTKVYVLWKIKKCLLSGDKIPSEYYELLEDESNLIYSVLEDYTDLLQMHDKLKDDHQKLKSKYEELQYQPGGEKYKELEIEFNS